VTGEHHPFGRQRDRDDTQPDSRGRDLGGLRNLPLSPRGGMSDRSLQASKNAALISGAVAKWLMQTE
jgi:hypothetical protein